jgi:tyrosyl-tRNA synthetase
MTQDMDIEGRRRPAAPTTLDQETLRRITHRGVAEIIEEREFVQLIQVGKPIRLKMGFDPSAPDIHLGHVVGLRKLRQLQELGHQVVLIVGDWTALIGDPSGQSVTRPMLTRQQVESNAETYLRQFFQVVDKERTEVRWQSEWFGKFGLEDVIRLTSRFTVAQFLQREDFRNRWDAGRPITITELLYPLMQAYDSVAVQADVEFGGTDQKFNLLLGRELQVSMEQRPQQCFLVPILVGTDGVRKMSKSLGNYIAVEEPPQEQYGKLMSLPDDLIVSYFELLTDVTEQELAEMRSTLDDQHINPMDLKKRLALDIVGQFWDQEQARQAQDGFERVFQRHEAPEDVEEQRFTTLHSGGPEDWKGELIVLTSDGEEQRFPFTQRPGSTAVFLLRLGLASSVSEGKRLLSHGAVEVDGKRLQEQDPPPIYDGAVYRVGKRRFRRLVEEPGP